METETMNNSERRMWPYGGRHARNVTAAEGDMEKDALELRAWETGAASYPYTPTHRAEVAA